MSAGGAPPPARIRAVVAARPPALARPAAALVGAGAALLVVQVLLSARVTGPVIVADEFGYLAAARWLAGAEVVPLLGPSPFYWPGYALLLAPLQAALDDPAAVHRAAQVLNAGLSALHLLPLYVLARRVCGLDRPRAALVALAAGAYPAFLLQSAFAWTECLVPLLVTSWVVAVAALARRPTALRAAGLAGLAGLMYATHPRLVALAPLTAAVLVLLWRRGGLGGRAAPAAGALLAGAVVGTHALNRVILERVYLPGYPGASSRRALEALTTPEGWADLALASAGQAWYLTAATLGLAPLGALWLARRGWAAARSVGRRGRPEPAGLAALAALAGAGSVVAISCVWMADNLVKPDKYVYGRYNEAFAGVLLAAGLAWLMRARPHRRAAALGAGAAAVLVLAAVVRAGHGAGALDQPFSPVTVLGVMPLVRGEGLPVMAAGMAGAVAIAVLALVAARAPRAAAGLLATAFVLAAADVSARHVEPWADGRTAAFPLRALSGDLAGLGPVSYDRSDSGEQAADDVALFGYQWWLDASPLRFYRARDGERPPTGLVMSDRRPAPEARWIAGADPALWVMPGPTEAAAVRRGLLPARAPGRAGGA